VHETDCGALPVIGTTLPNTGVNYLSYTGRFGGTSYACPQVAGGPDYYDVELYNLYSSGQPAPKQAVFLLCPNTTYHIYLMNNSSCSTSNYVWTIPSAWTKYYQYNNYDIH